MRYPSATLLVPLASVIFQAAPVRAADQELILERSIDLQTWEEVTLSAPMIGENGRLRISTELPVFYRMDIRLKSGVPDGFSYVPAGTFTMGSPASEPGRDSDETQHTVTLSRAFFLQRREVTKSQWDAVRAEGAARGYTDLPVGRNGYSGDASGTHPVTEVSWLDAVKWLNLRSELEGLTPCYTVGGVVMKTGTSTPECDFTANGHRLPTEAEWEYACRAGTTTAFHSGPITITGTSPVDPNLDLIGWYGGNSGNNTHPAGHKGANAWGLYDMSGNVWEWCWDWYGTYPDAVTDPTGTSPGSHRVLRGGSFFMTTAGHCRSAFRGYDDPTFRRHYFGFRPARSE